MFINPGELRMSTAEVDELQRQLAQRDLNIVPRPFRAKWARNSLSQSQAETLRRQLVRALKS
jgi:hypothetical protein